jgi:hypothetical protein
LTVVSGCGGADPVAEPSSTLHPFDQAIADGYVARCNDGNFSNNLDFDATCSGGDGINAWLSDYGRCQDGTVLSMRSRPDCGSHGGFDELMPRDFQLEPADDDIAMCNDGNYSNNLDLRATCSGGDGVDHWLAEYGECSDGTYIEMGPASECPDGASFVGLTPAGFTPPDPAATPTTAPGPRPDDVALCNDGNYSNNHSFHATCSGGGGIDRWLAPFGECSDGTVIEMSDTAECPSGATFRQLLPEDYTPPEPEATELDIARCVDGNYSDNTSLDATCSSHGGVAEWLAPFGRCDGGTIIRMREEPRCPSGESFVELMPADFVPPFDTFARGVITQTLRSGELRLLEVAADRVTAWVGSNQGLTAASSETYTRRSVAEVLEALQEAGIPDGVNAVEVAMYAELTNAYGEVNDEIVIIARFSPAVVNRIVFDNVDPEWVYLLADLGLFVHPALE